MAYENFKPTIWSKFIQHELEKKAVLLDHTWRKFQGEVQHAKNVKILGVGKPSIGNYTGASIGTPETIADSSVVMPIDQAKYFNFMVDDVDEAQSIPGLMEALMQEATLAMALEIDSYIADVVAAAAINLLQDTAGHRISLVTGRHQEFHQGIFKGEGLAIGHDCHNAIRNRRIGRIIVYIEIIRHTQAGGVDRGLRRYSGVVYTHHPVGTISIGNAAGG